MSAIEFPFIFPVRATIYLSYFQAVRNSDFAAVVASSRSTNIEAYVYPDQAAHYSAHIKAVSFPIFTTFPPAKGTTDNAANRPTHSPTINFA